MDPSELLLVCADKLDRLGVSYLVTGSMASILYGEPRFTNDIDIAIQLESTAVEDLCAVFPEPEFYVAVDAARAAARARTQFNVIHPGSGLKIDFMIPANDEFDRSRFQRGVLCEVHAGRFARFASAEDVIVKKLEYFRSGQSEKHIRDIEAMLRVSTIDIAYVESWVVRRGLSSEWERVRL